MTAEKSQFVVNYKTHAKIEISLQFFKYNLNLMWDMNLFDLFILWNDV